MLTHVLESTIVASLLSMAAHRMRRSALSARTRHAFWLLAFAKFTIPSFLLWAAGASLGALVPFRPALNAPVANLSRILVGATGNQTFTVSTGGKSRFITLLVCIWVSVALSRLLVWIIRLRASSPSITLPDAALERAFEVARQHVPGSKRVPVFTSEQVTEPVLIGVWRPFVVMPRDLVGKLSAGELEAVLLHELVHAARRDNLSGGIAHLISAVFWFHPLLPWMERQLAIDCEYACDEVVLATTKRVGDYASGIGKAARFALAGPIPGISGIGGSELKMRLELIMSAAESLIELRPRWGLLASAIITAILIPVTGGFASTSLLGAQSVQKRHGIEFIGASATHNTRQTQQILAELKILLNPNDTVFPANNNRWDKWLDEDVAYLISPQERAAFVALQSDAQREQFVNQFWEKRNPTPGSLQNSFKVEHYRRIAFANDRFAVPDTAGWQTDRGRVYILMGPPDEIDSHPNQNREMWRYRLGDITIEFDISDRQKS